MKGLKAFVKRKMPFLGRFLRQAKIQASKLLPAEFVFKKIYSDNLWGHPESRSGPGSTIAETKVVRRELKKLIEEFEIGSMLDIPCGDYNWLKEVELNTDYTGADVVQKMVEDNVRKFGGERRHFVRLDILKDRIPRVDMIFCRDLLVHFNNRQIFRAIDNIRRSSSKYLLITTFPRAAENIDIITGEWRALDLCKPPFNFPSPVKLIVEGCTETNPIASNKCLGLWKIADI